MRAALIALALAGAAPASASGPSGAKAPAGVDAHGVQLAAPEGWTRTEDSGTVVFSSPEKQASVRIDTFEKDKAGDAQDCLDQIVGKLTKGDRKVKESFSPGVLDGQPSATQVSFSDDRKHKNRQVVGCNGKSYFLVDWTELTHAGPKYEKTFTKFLAGIKYAKGK